MTKNEAYEILNDTFRKMEGLSVEQYQAFTKALNLLRIAPNYFELYETYDEDILNTINEPAALEQLAEECAELGHAALKLSRIIRKENPTPVTEEEARENLVEELSDVLLTSVVVMGLPIDFDTMAKKKQRWLSRLNEVKGE